MRAETELRFISTPQKQDRIASRVSQRPVTRWRERERPAPTALWLNLAFAFASCAFATGLTALIMPADAPVRPSEMWIASAGLLLAMVICIGAHRDVNLGRVSREREVEEVEP